MPSRSSVKILLIEDCHPMRTITSMVLRSFGFLNQRFAEDGETAFQLVREYAPDLIITDITLPDIDGRQLIRRIRHELATPLNTTQILVLTAYATEVAVRSCLACGIDQFLAKPLAPAALAQRLNAMIDEERKFVRQNGYFGPIRYAPSGAEVHP